MTKCPGYNAFVHWFFSEMFINMSHIVKVTFCWQSHKLWILYFLYLSSFIPVHFSPFFISPDFAGYVRLSDGPCGKDQVLSTLLDD